MASVFGSCKDRFVQWQLGLFNSDGDPIVRFISADESEVLDLCLAGVKSIVQLEDGSVEVVNAVGEDQNLGMTTVSDSENGLSGIVVNWNGVACEFLKASAYNPSSTAPVEVEGVVTAHDITTADNVTTRVCLDPLKDLRDNGNGSFTTIFAEGREGDTFQFIPDTDQRLTNPVITQEIVDGTVLHTVTWDIVDIEGNVVGQESATGVSLPVFADKTGTVLSGPITIMQQSDFLGDTDYDPDTAWLYGEDAQGECRKYRPKYAPAIGVSKKITNVDPAPLAAGSEITWDITVWNAGCRALTDVTVTEDNATLPDGLPTELGIGDSFTVQATQTVRPEDEGQILCNQVSVSGTDAAGSVAQWVDSGQVSIPAPDLTEVCVKVGAPVEDTVQDNIDYSQVVVGPDSATGYLFNFSNAVWKADVTNITTYGTTAPASFTGQTFHDDMVGLPFNSIANSPPVVEGQVNNGSTAQPGWGIPNEAGIVYDVTWTLMEVLGVKGTEACPASVTAQVNFLGISRGVHNTPDLPTSFDFGDANPEIVSQTANMTVFNTTEWTINAAPGNGGLEISIEEYFMGDIQVGDQFTYTARADRSDAIASRVENVACQEMGTGLVDAEGTLVSATDAEGNPIEDLTTVVVCE